MMFLILCIFLLMAALVGVRAGRALGLRPLGVAVCGLASVAILPLFVLVHFAGGGWSPATARAAAFAADIWLAVLFWMSCILLRSTCCGIFRS